MLPGTTRQLLEARLAGGALPSRRTVVRLADVPSFAAAFVANSSGVGAVTRIDEERLPVTDMVMATLTDTYESTPLDHI